MKVVVLAAISLCSMAGTAWAGGWVPTGDLPFTATDIAFDGEGNATVVGYGYAEEGGYIIQAITRSPGGTWQPPEVLMMHNDVEPEGPQVAVNSQGEAVAVWGIDLGPSFTAWATSRDADGVWQEEPDLLSSGAGAVVYWPDIDVVIDEAGTATATWSEFDVDSSSYVLRSRTRPAEEGWGGAIDVSDPANGTVNDHDLTVNSAGDVAVAWEGEADSGVGRVVRVRKRAAGGSWESEDEISGEPGIVESSRVALADDGGLVVVWQYTEGGDPHIVTASKPVDGNWSAEPDVLDFGYGPELAIDSDGNATAIWAVNLENGSQVRTSSKPAGEAWSDPTNRATGLDADGEKVVLPWIGVDHEDTLTALWARIADGETYAESARLSTGGSWSQAGDMHVDPGPDEAPAVGIDPAGHVVAVWSVPGSPLTSGSAVLDWVAPELRDLQVPTEGFLNQPVAFSVSPFDAWSSVETEWNFAENVYVGGTQVAHTYSAVGEHAVYVTATDEAGNETDVGRTITIKEAPAPKPEPKPNPTPDKKSGPTQQCKTAKKRNKKLKANVRRSTVKVKTLNRRLRKAKSAGRKRNIRVKRNKARKTLTKQKKTLRNNASRVKRLCKAG